ncbi:hypothetical protein [Paenibacillus lactis]|uniref:hypothetical protein n=1 Tax=Paenibacillus lactis TaxID=228574 RepID=UPI001B034572|nr:hypothetical protein [Paenibacillus lactis]GIO90722.1 hypothetical protein J31TS3_19490 [Paenibacillus lactis]
MTEDEFLELENGLLVLNKAIEEDPSNMDLIWKTIEYQIDRDHLNFESLSDVIDRIYNSPAGSALEFLLASSDSDLTSIKQYITRNASFYLSLRERFRFGYLATVRSYNLSPFGLFHIEPVSSENDLYRFFRSDRSFMDIELDVEALFYLHSMVVTTLLSTYNDDDTAGYIKERVVEHLRSLNEFLAEKVQ